MKCGFIAIAGAPNAGKSTLLNRILGFKLAIVSNKPQTTRHRILGVHTQDEAQMIFLDTPGLHQARGALNRRMMDVALESLREADALLMVVDASGKGLELGRKAASLAVRSDKPALLALNKIDVFGEKQRLLPILQQAEQWGQWQALVPVSARSGEGVERLLGELVRLLPESPPMFPADTLTDLSERFLAAELVREKVFRFTRQDIPYASAVTIDEFVEPGRHPVTAISATIHVERESQKAIIIGKNGSMLKTLGTAARQDLERMLGGPVFLKLLVRVEPRWSHDGAGLSKLGY